MTPASAGRGRWRPVAVFSALVALAGSGALAQATPAPPDVGETAHPAQESSTTTSTAASGAETTTTAAAAPATAAPAATLAVTAAYYQRLSCVDETFVNVWTNAPAGARVFAVAPGVSDPGAMVETAPGVYFAHLHAPIGPAPATVQVYVAGQTGTASGTVTDIVTITHAQFATGSGTLRVEATSTDACEGTLEVAGVGALVGGHLAAQVAAPPATITVTSSGGGTATSPVVVRGEGAVVMPVVASAGPDLQVDQGTTVTLDGSGTIPGPSGYLWEQVSGPGVSLSDPAAPAPTFTAPILTPTESTATLVFRVTVEGILGVSSDDVQVVVLPLPPPEAGVVVPAPAVPTTQVTLDASPSARAELFTWNQVSGTPVQLTGADTAIATFVFPVTDGPLVFQVTVTNSGGSDSETVTVEPVLEVLLVTRADFHAESHEWRLSGTSSLLGVPAHTVTVYLGADVSGAVIGTAVVDETGVWRLVIRNAPVEPEALESVVSITSNAGGEVLNTLVGQI